MYGFVLLFSLVTLCLCTGRWESRVGIPGSKHIYLGLFEDESEAAEAYDQAVVRLRGEKSITNFPIRNYREDLEAHRSICRQQNIGERCPVKVSANADGMQVCSNITSFCTFSKLDSFSLKFASY